MSLARVVVTAVIVEGRSKTQVAKDCGVARSWVYELLKRFEAEGEAAFETEMASLKIVQKNSRPYYPQTCGKVERFHQTLKLWLVKQPRVTSIGDFTNNSINFMTTTTSLVRTRR